MIQYKRDTNNIVTITFDMEDRNVNVINHEIGAAFLPVLEHLKIEKAKGLLKGIILTSAKPTFLASGDLDYLYQLKDPQVIFRMAESMKWFLRELEKPGIPVAAALNGNALGIGFEVALACHYRIVLDRPDIRLGLPDIHFGLIPSSGGIIRLMWLLGIEQAFEILVNGEAYLPKSAKSVGLVDELVQTEKELVNRAKQWLLLNGNAAHPWDREGSKIPGGGTDQTSTAIALKRLAARIVKEKLNNYPAPQAILDVLFAGSKVDFDSACRIESRMYTKLLKSTECKNMIKAFWTDHKAIEKGVDRPKGFGKFRPKKVGIIGAGQMGIRIALACILAGKEVIIKDVSKLIAEQGRTYIEGKLELMERNNRIVADQIAGFLGQLTITDQSSDFKDCDIVIEAVFENQMLKQKVTREAERHLDEYSVIGTNTLTIPITKLAKQTRYPENYVGIHFFHPADEIPLVEIVRGKQTSSETIARAFDFVRAINKIPIVVKDGWGFFANRVRNTYILEGLTMLEEGLPAAMIENLGKKAGMPDGALKMADDIGLPIIQRYESQAAERYGMKYIQHPAVSVLDKMIKDLDRPGKFKQRGFYNYQGQQPLKFWTELNLHFPSHSEKNQDKNEIIERFLFAQVIEAFWCIQEKVIASYEAANIGSIYGSGFPGFKGGVIQYVYDYGIRSFIGKCKQFEAKYGRRFQVPRSLLSLIEVKSV